MYRIQRGLTTLPEPMLTAVAWASIPSVDKTGNLYFKGQRPGISAVQENRARRNRAMGMACWYSPGEWGGGPQNLIADPNGSYVAFTYEIKGTYSRDHKVGIGLLFTQTSKMARF